jgi:hypothetical protein
MLFPVMPLWATVTSLRSGKLTPEIILIGRESDEIALDV